MPGGRIPQRAQEGMPGLLSPRVELLEWSHSIVIVGQRKEHGRACHPATQKFHVKGRANPPINGIPQISLRPFLWTLVGPWSLAD